MSRTLRLLLSASLAWTAAQAAAQDYPNRPLRIIVPFAPGGATDVPARLVAPKMSEALGQPVIVENRPGAGGIIGVDAVVKAPRDGYTLLMATNGELVMNPFIYSKLPYDPFKDLAPVSIMIESPLVMIVPNGSPFNSAAEVIAAAKAKPGELTYATAGTGSTSHVLTEMMAQHAGIRLLHVPYKGGAPASAAMVSGEVAMGLLNLGSSTSLMKGGRAKALAITSATRNSDYPSLPTLMEQGVPDFADGIWVGMAAPAGVAQEIIERLSTEVRKALADSEVRARLAQLGVQPLGTTPEEAAARIRREVPRYREAITSAGIKAN
jgi:tripartite-type tricarboxylate transporter receptor subunit TctC